MELEAILIGLFALLVGLAFCFFGIRLFLILLPIWGFLTGFVIGAGAWTTLFPSDSFLATTTSWVIGFVVAIIFAVLAYFYYYAAILILAGSIGFALTAGVLGAIGMTGVVAFLVALAVAVLFGIVALVLNVPMYLVLVLTAIGGAITAVGGVLVTFNQVPLESLSNGILQPTLDHTGLLAEIAIVVVAIAGGLYQWRTMHRFEVLVSDYQNPGLSTAVVVVDAPAATATAAAPYVPEPPAAPPPTAAPPPPTAAPPPPAAAPSSPDVPAAASEAASDVADTASDAADQVRPPDAPA